MRVKSVFSRAGALVAVLVALSSAPAAGETILSVVAANPKMAASVREIVIESSPDLRRLTGASLDRIKIIISKDLEDFETQAKALGGPRWAAALAVPQMGLILSRSPGQLTNPRDFRLLLIHELTHLHLAAALGRRRPPLWLEEGLCMYAAGEGGWGRAVDMARGVLGGEFIPFADLDKKFPIKARSAGLAYAQSYYFIGYLLSKYGPETPALLIKALDQGMDVTTALHQVTGKGLVAVEGGFKAAMESRFSWLAVLTTAGALWGVLAVFMGVGLVVRRRRQLKRRREMDKKTEGSVVYLRPLRPPSRPGGRLQDPAGTGPRRPGLMAATGSGKTSIMRLKHKGPVWTERV